MLVKSSKFAYFGPFFMIFVQTGQNEHCFTIFEIIPPRASIKPESDPAPTLVANQENGNSTKNNHNVLLVTDDKCDHGSATPAASTMLTRVKTAAPLQHPTRTYDEDQATNTSKKSLKKSQSPSPNKCPIPKNSSATNHTGPHVLLSNLLTAMF